jgi:hypothetical protein
VDHKKIKLPTNRNFGYFFTVIFLIISIYFYFREAKIALYISVIISLTFSLITFFKSDILTPLNKLWMNFGLILGMIVSPIIMALIFFFFLTPIAILTRLFGRDELQLKLKNKYSYWHKKNIETQSNSFKKQF